MLYKKIKSFTLSELILVVAIIGVLTLGMTAYMGNSGERAKIVEAQGCANAIGGVLKNYVYNALTSKNLKTGDTYISPDYYYIDLISKTSDDIYFDTCFKQDAENEHSNVCKEIKLGYYTGSPDDDPEHQRSEINTYQIINVKNTCHQGKTNLGYYRSGGGEGGLIYYIRMNKGFTPRKVNEKKTFYLQEFNRTADNNLILIGDIIVVLCYDKECSSRKHIGRRHIDARSQTIEFQKCKFYKEEEPTRCKTREGETDDET